MGPITGGSVDANETGASSVFDLTFGPDAAGSWEVTLVEDPFDFSSDVSLDLGPLSPSDLPFPSTAPLPGALPLFAGGLGVFGFLMMRKKRKPTSLAAT
jgi:hypothetical protein